MSDPTSLHELSATQAAGLIRERQVSPVELLEALLTRIHAVETRVLAWETIDADGALRAARGAEEALATGGRSAAALGPLHGVPFGAKDIYDTGGVRTAAGFRPYDQRIPATDAEPVARLKRAGGVLLGKTVTTQFAHADPPKTRNPWSAERTPGGSSSGSAAGVAAREVPLALGSQTAGSILRPAGYNGVVGFKPTYGRVSKRGVLPLAWSLDHVGVLARSVADCRVFFGAVAGSGRDELSTSERSTGATPRFGLLRAAVDRAAPRVQDHLSGVAGAFERAGASVVEARLEDGLDLILAVHHVIMQTEAAAVHWQLLEQYPGSHAPRLRAYVELGRLLPGAAYLHAQRLRRRIRHGVLRAVAAVDALLLPTATDVAPPADTTGDPSLQAPFSLVGFPSLSLPSGVVSGLPVAIQLVGAPGHDEHVLDVATWCEAHLPPMPGPPLG